MYYDRMGTAISEQCWKDHWADEQYRLVARTEVGEWTVAAWWAGVDEDGDAGGAVPRVFRSALLVPPRQAGSASPLLQEWRHATAEGALAHHDQLVGRLRSDDVPVPAAAAPSQGCHCH